ncbi:hypothetical protein D3C85_1026020 [compost metagenome]
MIKKKKITLLLIFLFSSSIFAQYDKNSFKVESIKYDEFISFPYIVSSLPKNNEVANRINRSLQDILFGEGEIINRGNLNLIKEHLYIEKDNGKTQSGISSLSYTIDFYVHFLKITINTDWAGGPYPVGAETDYLQFDLKKGELIQIPDLIDGEKYFDFLEKFWLKDCRNSIREAHQCAYGNKTGDYESQKALTLDGECEFQCHKVNNFILTNDSIVLSNNSNCFPHMWQNCNIGSSKKLKIKEIKEYLSDYGKWLLGFSDTYSDIKPILHFVGKIDGKYKISMSLNISKANNINGTYFYWKQNKLILLKGQINETKKKIILNELIDNTLTGSFELEWDDFLYSTDGFWYNSSREKKLSVKLLNIYDYSNRVYNR